MNLRHLTSVKLRRVSAALLLLSAGALSNACGDDCAPNEHDEFLVRVSCAPSAFARAEELGVAPLVVEQLDENGA